MKRLTSYQVDLVVEKGLEKKKMLELAHAIRLQTGESYAVIIERLKSSTPVVSRLFDPQLLYRGLDEMLAIVRLLDQASISYTVYRDGSEIDAAWLFEKEKALANLSIYDFR